MRSKPACLGGIWLDFPEFHLGGNLSHEHVQVGHPGKVGEIFSLKSMRMFWNFFQIRFPTGYDEYYQKSKI